MPAELATEKFLTLLERSGIVPQDKMQRLLDEFGEEASQQESSQKIAEELVSRGVLTQWQVNMLLQGKHRGFILGTYRILKPLGRGGMGAVYLAEHQMMRRRCAIKVLPSNFDRESSILDRFYREAQAVAALDHPNIVRAYDVNKCIQNKKEIHYLVMEYIEGQDFQKMVEDGGVLGYRQAAEFIRQGAEGLAHAHAAGFVHRDIKPANLLVDLNGVVKILDLGLARFFDDSVDGSLTRELGETVLGTADYLAPEQALDSHDVDARADIYSLGQTLYFLLKGHPPFPQGTVAQRLMAHQMKSPEPISKSRPDAPRPLLAIIDKMTAKKPEHRYQSAEDVAEAVKGWLAGQGEDSGFLRRASRLSVRSTPAVSSSAEPTHPKATSMEETELELELAPIDEEEPEQKKTPLSGINLSSSGTKLESTPSDSGLKAREDDALSEQQSQTAPAASGDSSVEPKEDSPEEYPLAVDLEDLKPLDTSSAEAALAGDLPVAETVLSSSPAASSGAMRATSSSGIKRKKTTKGTDRDEKTGLAAVLDSPLFWIGLAAVVVIGLVIAIVASLPDSREASGVPARSLSPGPASLPAPEDQEEPATEGPRDEPSPEPDEPPRPAQTRPQQKAPGRTPVAGAHQGPSDQTPAGSQGRRGQAQGPGGRGPDARPEPGQAAVPESERAGGGTRKRGTPQTRPPQAESSPPATVSPADHPTPEPPPKVETPDPQTILADLKELAWGVHADDKDKKLLNDAFISMLRYGLESSMARADVKLAEGARSVLHLTLVTEKEGPYTVFFMSAELKYRVSDSHEAAVWERAREEIGRFAGQQNPRLLRENVTDFFNQLSQDCRKARQAN